jgi:PIN domain nuclease of toxin-antitoxin system
VGSSHQTIHQTRKMPLYGLEYMHFCEQADYECLSVRERHMVALESLLPVHNDPFDRILVSRL